MPFSSSSFPDPLRNQQESTSQSPNDTLTRLTPSDDGWDDGPPANESSDAYELQPISNITHVIPGQSDALRVPRGEEEASLLPSPRRFSVSSVQSYELYTPNEERAVRRKLDRRLVSFMALLYCLSFLDRSSEYVFIR